MFHLPKIQGRFLFETPLFKWFLGAINLRMPKKEGYLYRNISRMIETKQLIETFYTAFKNKDYKTMQACYSDKAVFSDEVFKDLNAEEVRNMWEMLIKRGTDLDIVFKNIETADSTGSAEWIATYSFGPKKRKVLNKVNANFVFENGKIVKHTDHFSFYKWSGQALGTPGLLLGWTSFLKNKVQKIAMKGLSDFMQKK
jgi:hypothetical protein